MGTEIVINKEEYETVVKAINDAKNNLKMTGNSYVRFQTRNMQTYKNYITAHQRLTDIVTRYKEHISREIVILSGIETSMDRADQVSSKSIINTKV